eukprot:4222084-Prymnesium_polylepis.1
MRRRFDTLAMTPASLKDENHKYETAIRDRERSNRVLVEFGEFCDAENDDEEPSFFLRVVPTSNGSTVHQGAQAAALPSGVTLDRVSLSLAEADSQSGQSKGGLDKQLALLRKSTHTKMRAFAE